MSSRASLSSLSSQGMSTPTSPSSKSGDDPSTETDEPIESILTGSFEDEEAQPVHNLEKAAGMNQTGNGPEPELKQGEQVEKEEQGKQQVGGGDGEEFPVQVYHGGFFIHLPPRSQPTTFLIQPTAWSVSVCPTSTWDPNSTVAAFSGLNINGGQTCHPSCPSGEETSTKNDNPDTSMVPPDTQASNCLSCSNEK